MFGSSCSNRILAVGALAFACPILLPLVLSGGETRFRVQEIDTSLTVGYAVSLVDVNSDGRTDIVVVDTERVIWYENPNWQVHTLIKGKTKHDNVCIAPYDIDGDGRLDFALGADWRPIDTQTGGTMQWLRRGQATDDECSVHPIGEEPTRASRPFDRDRDSFVMSDGAAVVILEDRERARQRGAPILAEVAGYGMSGDAYHVTSPQPGGEGAVRCMRAALADAGVSAEDVGYINAHGTSTPINDLEETRAITTTFGEHARRLAISSTKSMLGHSLGSTGAVEAVLTALALSEGVLPPTINLENPDAECDLDYVPHRARNAPVDVAISNSLGFGGTNVTLVLRRHDPSA